MNKTYQELCDENQRLRDGIRSMATALKSGEWEYRGKQAEGGAL